MAQIQIPVIYRQVGWSKCVACADSRTRPGMMWLGKSPIGVDIWIQCVVCKGTQQVPRYQVLEAATGKEIDYEAQVVTETGEAIHHVPIGVQH